MKTDISIVQKEKTPKTLVQREKIQKVLIDKFPEFIKKLNELPPKDYVDTYLKLMPYGFSKVPEEKIDPKKDAEILIEEKTRTAKLIAKGQIENSDY